MLMTEQDIVLCRQAVRGLMQQLQFSLVDQTKMVTAASELSRNTVVYGGGGAMRWEILREPRTGLRLAFEDRGPGIENLDLALADGWTSGNGLGLGSMRERAEELGGLLTVAGGPGGRGTRITAVIPLDRTEH